MQALVSNGVDAGRLESEGYGLTRPVETNDTAAGRAANRRVEFNIVEQDATVPAEGQEAQGAASEEDAPETEDEATSQQTTETNEEGGA
jgi:chemotaxis protein MotB